MSARTPHVALLLVAALAASARADDASEEKLLAVEMAANDAERDRARREREALAKTDEDAAEILRLLDTPDFRLEFPGAPLEDAIGFIREYMRMNIEFDSAVREAGIPGRLLDVKVGPARLEEVLETVLDSQGLDWTIDRKVLVITLACPLPLGFDPSPPRTELHLPPVPGVESTKADDRIRSLLDDSPVALSFTNCTVADMAPYLTEYTGIPFVVEAGSVDQVAARRISFRCDGLPFRQAFDLILKTLDIHYFIRAGAIHLVAKEDLWGSAVDPRADEAKRDVLTALGKNDQGFEEFRHESTGIVLVRLPPGVHRLRRRHEVEFPLGQRVATIRGRWELRGRSRRRL